MAIKKDNKVIKFPAHKIRNPWLTKIRNIQKANVFNFFISLGSLLVGLAIIWFMVYKMNL